MKPVHLKVARIGEFIQPMRFPPPRGRDGAHLRVFQNFWMVDQVQVQRLARFGVVVAPGDLDKAAASILGAVAGMRIA